MFRKQQFSDKSFPFYNTAFLLLLFFYCWFRQFILSGAAIVDIIFWPGAYFLSLWILSPAVLYFFSTTIPLGRSGFLQKNSLLSTGFGLLHFLFTGLLILVLERFFRLPEHYSLSRIGDYLLSYWPYAIEGLLWYWLYTGVLLFAFNQKKLKEEKKKLQEIEQELVASQLNMLRTELNPHFLFNAMNSIAMKVRLKENTHAVSMIAALNDLLRVVLSRKKEKMIGLKEEIEILDKYLSIEKTRFGEQVEIQLSFPEHLHKARVPQLILQPLVENAFKHGIKESLSKQVISVSAEAEENFLVLRIYNTSAAGYRVISADYAGGIGLSNVIHRLRRLYGTNFRFQAVTLDKGVEFRISLPYRPV